MAADFTYYQPVKIIFGEGKLSCLSDVINELGTQSAVLVCDTYFLDLASDIKRECPAVKAVFAGVEPNPQLSGAREAVKLARAVKAGAIIGLGGGSSIDTAKFAAAVAMGDDEPEAYYAGKPFPKERLAIIAIPTTSGTGSEVTQVSVMNDKEVKKTINDPAFMPRAAIVDPKLMRTVPPRTTMITGLDALSHALEGYWSRNHQPLTDLYAIQAVRLILKNLEAAWKNGLDGNARGNMAYAALLAGLAFGQPKTAGSHACSYPLSMDYHLAHGEACAFTLDSFVRINADERLEELSRSAGLANSEELANRIRDFKIMGGLCMKLSDLGEVNVDKLAADCASHPLMKNNPVAMDAAALREMFEKMV